MRQRTARLRRLDDVLGGGDTYRVYLGEYQATKTMLREGSYTEETGRALRSVLAEQAQQAGWAAFDAGKHADATSLYETSHQAATEAGDTALAGNALAFLAYQEINTDRSAGMETAVQACRTAGPDAPPGVRALLHERLAWAYAVAGNASETDRALSIAESALGEGDGSPQPDWSAWVDRNELQIMTGRCWTELRRPLRAVPVLEDLTWRETVSARIPLPDGRATLQVPDATPIMLTARVTLGNDDRPLILEELRASADRAQLAYHITADRALRVATSS
ncbi:hypothetical protein [Streptomyces sp. NA02950]|uniref:hypothetical protein n=1 Tax=Streptomyces sp. NA02950 TaxID=2742137 RepID=UPI0020CAD017|nr:hypothetical protein [Streptomyces sp. NA02950]